MKLRARQQQKIQEKSQFWCFDFKSASVNDYPVTQTQITKEPNFGDNTISWQLQNNISIEEKAKLPQQHFAGQDRAYESNQNSTENPVIEFFNQCPITAMETTSKTMVMCSDEESENLENNSLYFGEQFSDIFDKFVYN